jgi:hypothetical protein
MHAFRQLIVGMDDAQAEMLASEIIIREAFGPAGLRTGEGEGG